MANNFHRITRSMQTDRGLTSKIGMAIALTVLAAWTAWAFGSKVTRYEVSDSARLEVDSSADPVQTPLAGRVVSSTMLLGRTVEKGEILAELDSAPQHFSLEEERARYSSIQPQIALLAAQLGSERAGADADRNVSTYTNAGAVSQYHQADIEAVLAEGQAERARQMRMEGILAPADADRATAEAQSKRAAAESLKAVMSRLQPELQVKERDRDVKVKEIAASQAKLEADLQVSAATIQRLQEEIERRKIRAPISGRLAECAPLPPGSHVAEGQQLGVILPSSQIRVVAQFQPGAALGKLHAGQLATVRLDGFPWAQFGVVTARVTGVADEIRDGRVRVELAVTQAPKIPIQHGLPGVVEVETERTTPAAMLLRSAGTLAGAR